MAARTCLLLLVELVITGGLGCTTLLGIPSGETGEAAAASTRAEAAVPKRRPRASTYVAYGDLYEKAATEPGRSPAAQEELRNKARRAYQEALQVHPNDLPALLALARLSSTAGDYDRAVADYNRVIQVYPKEAALRYELGMCHARRKNWDLALQSLQKAVQADPENRRYAQAYGLCLARAQRFNDSFAFLAKLEGTAQAHYDLARMLHHLDQDEACKAHLRLALTQNPDLIAARQLLAELEAATGDPPNGIIPAAAQSPTDNAAQPILENPSEGTIPAGLENTNKEGPQAAEVSQEVDPPPQKAENR